MHRSWFQLLAIVGLVLVSGCQSVDSKVWIYQEYPSCDAPIRLLINGQEVAEADRTGRAEPGTLTAKQKALLDRLVKQYSKGPLDVPVVPADNPSLTLQMLTPDGWIARPVRLNANLHLRPEEYSVSPEDPPTVILLLDNRNCPKSELEYGEWKVTVEESQATEIRAPAAQLPANTGVRLNGQSIGSLDLPLRAQTYLIDCSGKRSYHRQDVGYGLPGYGFHAPPEQFEGGKHLYAVLGEAEYFLTPAPKKMMVPGGTPATYSSELVEDNKK